MKSLLIEFEFMYCHKLRDAVCVCTSFSTPQINTWSSDWIEFYGEKRLGYQLKLARDRYGDSAIYEKGFSLCLFSIVRRGQY